MNECLQCGPGPRDRTVRTATGEVLAVPDGWELLLPGDALVTRKVKAGGVYWAVSEKVRNKQMSRGVWAPATRIANARAASELQRGSPEHARQLAAGRARREREQAEYVVDFARAVERFLAFAPQHAAVGATMADRIAAHATPVGSGTVARTERIPIDERAEAAVIAWMRHQTTAYDHMSIARIKGERREVRRMLAQRSRALLERYRRGEPIAADCPLALALGKVEAPVAVEVPRVLTPPAKRTAVAEAGAEARAGSEDDEVARRAAREAAVRARLAARR